MILKAATAYSRKFLMVLTSDHISGATGKTVTVKLSKGPGAAGTTAAGSVTELDSTNLPGVYQVALTTVDTGVAGDLWYTCSASACDNTDFCDQVQAQVFTDLTLNASGAALIGSAVKQNTQFLLPFIMTVNSVPTPGLTGFTAQRSLGNAGFAACANSVVEIGSGWYSILLAATDTNNAVIEVLITATNADNRNITLYTQP